MKNISSPRTFQDIVRPGRAYSLLSGHALRKERIPVSDKQALGRVPAAQFLSTEKGDRLLL